MEKTPYIPKSWDLPEAFRQRLGASVGKQRLMNEDGHLLLLLHLPPRAEDNEKRQPAVAWRNPAGEWKSTPIAGGLAGIQGHIAAYRTVILELDDAVEKAKSPRDYFDAMRVIHPLQRSTRHLHEVLQATRAALPGDLRIINLRDEAAELERAIELIAADAKAGMEFTLAESSSQQARSSEIANTEARRLNRLAAFFLPLATLVAFFGMNPPRNILSSGGSWAVLAAGLLLGTIVYALVASRGRRT